MPNSRIHLIVAIWFACLLAGAVNVQAEQWFEPAFLCSVLVSPQPLGPGPIRLDLKVTPTIPCQEVTVSVNGIDNLVCRGSRSLTLPAKQRETTHFSIQLEIPADDTSGIELMLKSGIYARRILYSFVTTKDSTKLFPFNIRESYMARFPKRPPTIIHPTIDSTLINIPDTGFHLILIRDSLGNMVPEPAVLDSGPYAPLYTIQFDSLSAGDTAAVRAIFGPALTQDSFGHYAAVGTKSALRELDTLRTKYRITGIDGRLWPPRQPIKRGAKLSQ